MEINEKSGKGLLVIACTVAGAALFAVGGALLSTTEIGQEADSCLGEVFENVKDVFSGLLTKG